MRKISIAGVTGFNIMLLLAGLMLMADISYAAYSEPYSKNLSSNDEVSIGIPQYPRSIRRELPEVSKEHGIDVGPIKLHPSFISRVEYDDNIKLDDKDRDGDTIFTESPGIAGEAKLGNHRVEGGYGMEIVSFAKDHEENAINHLAYGLLELNFNDLQIMVQDNFEKSTNRLFSETSARDTLLINSVDVRALYDRPKWASEIGWRHNTLDHQTPEFQTNDYNEDVMAFLAGYKILPKTLLLIENDFGWVYYDDNNRNADQNYWQILGGVRGEPTERLAVTAKMGYQGRWLDDVDAAPSPTDFKDFVMQSDVVYRLTDQDIFRGGYERTPRISTFATNGWYRQDKIYLSFRKQFMTKWYASPYTSWQHNSYPEVSSVEGIATRRDDDFWQAGISLEYRIQDWLWARAKYNFRLRNSDFDTFDYTNNRYSVDVTFNY